MNLLLSFSFLCTQAFVLLLWLSSTIYAIKNNETDLQALLQFKAKITNDPFHVLTSWNSTTHFCQWQGISCGHRHWRVTVLNLQSLKLAGSLSPYIGNLSFLRELNLQNNSFSHEIPQQIGHLRRLEEIRLSNNSLIGKIPANLSSCSKLVVFRLGFNKLDGEIPEELGALSNLEVFSVSENNLTGNIPHFLGNFSQLKLLSLAINGFSGKIPDSLGQLRNLTFLTLRSNKLSGIIPSSIFNLSSITNLDIGENHFHGNLPSDIGFSLPNIRFFSISSNEFTGKIPASFFNATNLDLLSLLRNKLTGNVPSLAKLHNLRVFSVTSNYLGTGEAKDLNFLYSLINATELEELGINGNDFGGVIPEIIGNLSTNLEICLLDNNQLIGNLPSGVGNLVSLQDFEVWNNQLSGFIPDSIGKLQNLVVLALNNNMFSGNIPSSLGNLTNLIQLLAEDNNLSGIIPSSLGECENLLGLALSRNNLDGFIPPQVLSLSSLSIYLDLSENNLTGTLHMEVGNLKNLAEFDVSWNKLYGEIPRTLGSCTSLETLNMNDNNFQGSIPSSFASLRAIEFLDLSNNNLSSEIPEFFSHFTLLKYLNLSNNNFEGKVPIKGIFENSTATSVKGNKMLCGGISKFQLPKCKSLRHKKSKLTLKLKLVIATICALVGVTLALFFLFLFCLRKKKRKEKESASSSSFLKKNILELSYQTLYKGSDGFSSANMIGSGSFGSVYKGKLDGGETLIAIKVFNLTRHGAFKSFLAECEALRNIRHRNLVKVLTACSSVDYQGNDFKAIVYEFMVNGSLEEWLHPLVETQNLNFLQRLNIAIDVACALDYLHHSCETQIVHCDLKPSNVLLDKEQTGCVGDFGLARILREEIYNNSNESSSIGVRGTIGYAPPEYGIGNEVSTYGDVYSYGILLLEMFTGKRPTGEMFNESDNLHNFVVAALPYQVLEIVDPFLLRELEGNASTERSKISSVKSMEDSLISIFQIGVNCSAESPRDRTSILDVQRQLILIRDKLVITEIRGQRK